MQVVVMPDETEVEFPNPLTGQTSDQLLESLKLDSLYKNDYLVEQKKRLLAEKELVEERKKLQKISKDLSQCEDLLIWLGEPSP